MGRFNESYDSSGNLLISQSDGRRHDVNGNEVDCTGCGGVETDWNAQLAIGGLLNGLRGVISGLLSGLARGTAAAEVNTFATGQLARHFEKHGAEFGYKSAGEYLSGAQNLVRGGQGIQSLLRANGDTLFYRAASNEFAVLSRTGVIRTYFRPAQG